MCEVYFEVKSTNEEGVYNYKRPMNEWILAKIEPQRV